MITITKKDETKNTKSSSKLLPARSSFLRKRQKSKNEAKEKNDDSDIAPSLPPRPPNKVISDTKISNQSSDNTTDSSVTNESKDSIPPILSTPLKSTSDTAFQTPSAETRPLSPTSQRIKKLLDESIQLTSKKDQKRSMSTPKSTFRDESIQNGTSRKNIRSLSPPKHTPSPSTTHKIPKSNYLDHPCTIDMLCIHSNTQIRLKRLSSPHDKASTIASSIVSNTDIIRYGDTISLFNTENRALGIKKQNESTAVSFFKQKFFGNAEKWEILPNETVIVGTDSNVLAQHLNESGSEIQTKSSKLGFPVKVGDGVVLRNLHNFSILAYDKATNSLTTYTSNTIHTSDKPLPHPSTEEFYTLTPDEYSTWTIVQDNTVIFNYNDRLYSNGRFLLDSYRFDRYDECNGSIDDESPLEMDLLLELLGALMGLEGQYITIQKSDSIDDSNIFNDFIAPSLDMVEYALNPSLSIPTSLSNRIKSILPICTNYMRIRSYISTRLSIYDYGKIHQALAAAMDTLLQDYLTLLTQLEQWYLSSTLSIQRLYVMLQPYFSILQVLYNVISITHEYKGGQVLNLIQSLYQNHYKGDETSQSTILHLIQKASVPYLQMLKLWLYHGTLNDPYYEFMFVPFKNVPESWDYWYTFQPQHAFYGSLTISKQEEACILNTGKYLNAIRKCQDSIQSNTPTEFEYPLQSIPFHKTTLDCYNHASSSLLKVLFKDYDFMGILNMIRKYFLLDQGDFFVQFLDLAEKELSKDVHHVSKGHTMTLLSSCLPNIPLFCTFANCSIVEHLDDIHRITTGITQSSYNPTTPSRLAYSKQQEVTLSGLQAFMLDYTISFPLSLILPRNVIKQYQLLFRHIFYAKRVERQLLQIWQYQQVFKRYNRTLPLNPTFLLRQRMIHFLQNFIYYVQLEVMYPAWEDMEFALENVAVTVEDVVEVHTIFITRLLKESLVQDRILLESLNKVMNTCLGFSEQMKNFLDIMTMSDYSAKEEENIQKDLSSDKYTRMITRFTQVFDTQLDDFMELLRFSSDNESSSFLGNLANRLDYNGYYHKQRR